MFFTFIFYLVPRPLLVRLPHGGLRGQAVREEPVKIIELYNYVDAENFSAQW